MQLDDSRPIWSQLVDEFRRRIASGEWPTGLKVPSVRELALELGVNPNTVQKALGEVDRLGLTLAERTAGRFVTSDEAAIAAARGALAAAQAGALVATARGLGMTLPETVQLLTHRWTDASDTAHTERTPDE
ncbi:HTH-type transcriptional repressor YtrA [Leucobacter aridicollis]|uniref:DNA-binding transcriptional regulator YhcF (GntR family) n=1 Tax=Leucobacter aridicollis TaxID=283878 RepID=A0A852RGE5_9MICO|nr:GntR family transcriptional regulator [Leucobacter aridicollis]MBL3683523.1 GntR family transcriptional regulator [Leucobacter aridicollis]MCS3428886.1 DNA-binding transcriptional regulator YhcF (GntR family) [Leucobacter aridicollis]NYD28426.1 DNA-binding transcriptional regulator YhcF (GntR family) [Leucobacter aridicollis]RKQ90049.1 DNA-binding transcriptional regulator YhcF (GntR family) [Mycolicibacterium mucogenicum 261Sha1.1M5]